MYRYNHNFIHRDLSFYNDNYINAVKLAPMQIFTEAQFLEHNKFIGNKCDVMMTGLGLDILLSGLYLNKENPIYFGKKMLHNKMKKIKGNIIDYYIDNVKYRLKSTALINIFNMRFQKIMREMLFNQGKAPKAEGLYGYNWFNTPNRRFPTILDFQEFCKDKSIKIIDNYFLNTEEKKLVEEDPNLYCDTAIFVLSKT